MLDALAKANAGLYSGYGTDGYCERTADLIRQLCDAPKADVHFLVGGTQTNLTAIAAFLRPHEAVIAPNSGQINVHETGAVEASGHKILTSESADGKIAPEHIRTLYSLCTDEHMRSRNDLANKGLRHRHCTALSQSPINCPDG